MQKYNKTAKQKSLGKRIRARWQLYLFLLLPLIYIAIFAYYPMTGIQLAFKKYDMLRGMKGSKWVGLDNFRRFFSSYYFERTIGNTIRISLYTLLVGFPLPIVFACMLNTIRNQKYKKFVQMITYFPHFISTVVLVGMMMTLLNPRIGIYGILCFKLTGSYPTTDIFGIGKAFPHLYVWSGVWQSLGWDAIIYIAALSGVDAELHEAARIDGASRVKRIIHIDLPAIAPTIIMQLILKSGSLMNIGFEKAYLMQNTLNQTYSEVISTYAYKVAFNTTGGSDFGYSTAINLFNSIINFILIVIVNNISKKVSETSLW